MHYIKDALELLRRESHHFRSRKHSDQESKSQLQKTNTNLEQNYCDNVTEKESLIKRDLRE